MLHVYPFIFMWNACFWTSLVRGSAEDGDEGFGGEGEGEDRPEGLGGSREPERGHGERSVSFASPAATSLAPDSPLYWM